MVKSCCSLSICFIVVLLAVRVVSNRCATLEHEIVWLTRESRLE